MSPVEKRTSAETVRAIVTMSLGMLAVAGLAIWLLNGNNSTGEFSIGDEVFKVGDAESLADRVSDEGPLFFADPANGDRGVYVQHVGDDPETGWTAFDIRPDLDNNACTILWVADAALPSDNDEVRSQRAAGQTNQFVDCNGVRYPADGEGLTTFPTGVTDDGELRVDFRKGLAESSDSTPESSTVPPTSG